MEDKQLTSGTLFDIVDILEELDDEKLIDVLRFGKKIIEQRHQS